MKKSVIKGLEKGKVQGLLIQLLKNNGVSMYQVIEEMGMNTEAYRSNWYSKFAGRRQISLEDLELLTEALNKLLPYTVRSSNILSKLITPIYFKIK